MEFGYYYTEEDFILAEIDAASTGEWRLYTAIFDESSSELRLFVDDLLAGDSSTTESRPSQTTQPANIGRRPVEGDRHFDGSIDDLWLCDGALSNNDVSERYDEQKNIYE